MKRNLLISLLMVSVLFALNSCKKEYLVDVTGSVTGNVSEYYSNMPVQGVLVTIVANDKTMLKDSTNASGYYTISGVPIGYHTIIFSKAGYATVSSTVYVHMSDQVANTTNGKKQSYVEGIVSNAQLAPNTGKINGIVTFDGAPVSATVIANAFSYVSTDVSLEPTVFFTTTSDANGFYSFNNLPVNCKVVCTAYNGAASGSSNTSNLGIAQTITPTRLDDISISEEALYLVNYTGKGDNVKIDTTTASIVLTFSENLNAAIGQSHGVRNYLSAGTEVLGSVAISGNTLTITPTAGALTSGVTYTIHYDVYASATKEVFGTVTFTTKERAGVLTTPTLSYDGVNGLRITTAAAPTWTAGTVSYNVFFKPKTGGQADYKYVGPAVSGAIPIVISDVATTAAGSYYVIASAFGLDGVTVYSAPSNIATKD